MARPTLTIASRNYGSWSLRGWLMCKLAGLDVEEVLLDSHEPSTRAELLLLAPSFRVPCLTVDDVEVWDTLAIAEFLHEHLPEAGLLPADPVARAYCRSVMGEMHSGFANLRSALPMNLRASHTNFKLFSGVQADLDRIADIWNECFQRYGGPWLMGARPTAADAMYAPVCTRIATYGVEIDPALAAYCELVLAHPLMVAWYEAAAAEPEEDDDLEAEF